MLPPATGARRPGLRALAAAAFGLLFLAACASPRSYVVLLPSPDGSVGKVVIHGDKGEQVLDRSGQAGSTDGRAIANPIAQEKLDRDFGEAIAARPPLPVRKLLYFRAGVTLTPESEALISQIVEETRTRPAADLSVIGHTDTVANTEYNEKLAQRRAERVAEILQERGVTARAMVIESHGKRNLSIPTPDNTYEPRNRRVEVSIR